MNQLDSIKANHSKARFEIQSSRCLPDVLVSCYPIILSPVIHRITRRILEVLTTHTHTARSNTTLSRSHPYSPFTSRLQQLKHKFLIDRDVRRDLDIAPTRVASRRPPSKRVAQSVLTSHCPQPAIYEHFADLRSASPMRHPKQGGTRPLSTRRAPFSSLRYSRELLRGLDLLRTPMLRASPSNLAAKGWDSRVLSAQLVQRECAYRPPLSNANHGPADPTQPSIDLLNISTQDHGAQHVK
jgi:hypothetical protein